MLDCCNKCTLIYYVFFLHVGWQLTLTLLDYHQAQIAEYKQLAEETCQNRKYYSGPYM